MNTVERRHSPAQIVLIIAALMLLIEPLSDGWLGMGMLVENHIGSELWPDHAKYHVIRQGFGTIFVSLICVWGLWEFWDRGRGVRLILALIPFFLNASALVALVSSPAFGVENPVSQRGIGGPAIMLSMALTLLGLFLEARERNSEWG